MTLADYPVIKNVEIRPGVKIPLIDLPMMSDEEWNKLARKNAANYHKAYLQGIELEEQTKKEQHELIRQIILETADRDIDR